MDADGLESSHSISTDVTHPTQITEIFDAISYTKGTDLNYFPKDPLFN